MKTNITSQPTNVLIVESHGLTDNSLNIETPGQQFVFKKISLSENIGAELEKCAYSLVLLNLNSRDKSEFDEIDKLRASTCGLPLLLIGDKINETLYHEIAGDSSVEMLTRPISAKLLLSKIKSLCENFNNKKELLHLRQQVAMSYGFDNFVGLSRDILKIKRNLQHIAENDTTVILSGQDGTGKNLLARIIHYHSARRHNPFVAIDCSAYTAPQAELEIFGGITAVTEKIGIFERAQNGTVFIDKIDQLDSAIQSKLELYLRRYRTNSDAGNTNNSNGARLIMSVTNPVYDLVAESRLSKSLIDCLQAVELTLPPLSQRTEDIELLTAYFLRMISYENDSAPYSITPAAVEMLKRHDWPGQVRELENCLRRAAALCQENCLDIADISFVSVDAKNRNLRDFISDRQSKTNSLAESQRHLIAEALDANNWNFIQTAKQLGIGRTTLWRKIRKYNLSKESSNRLKSSGVTIDD